MAYPFASLKAKSVNHVSGTLCKLSVRAGHYFNGGAGGTRTPNPFGQPLSRRCLHPARSAPYVLSKIMTCLVALFVALSCIQEKQNNILR